MPGSGEGQAALRRAQALAPFTDTGVEIAQWLVGRKVKESTTGFYLDTKYIYGPDGYTGFYVEERHIYGPHEDLPWSSRERPVATGPGRN